VIKFKYKDIDANFIKKMTLPVPVCGNRDILTSLLNRPLDRDHLVRGTLVSRNYTRVPKVDSSIESMRFFKYGSPAKSRIASLLLLLVVFQHSLQVLPE
jgi:hypothetical protein